jgi:two-component system chemotaxis response regulator CheB
LESDRIRLTDDPKENYVRPAIDVLFRSAARAFGKKVVGVVLSGNLRDGASGLLEIKERGGMTLVQSPDEAEWPSMPLSAIAASRIDRVLPVAQIATEIVRYANLYDGSQGV